MLLMLPNGWSLTPVGEQLELGDLPLNMVLSSNKSRAIVSNNGQSKHSLMWIDTKTHKVLHELDIPKAWYGLALSKDAKTLYASGGYDNQIRIYNIDSDRLKLRDSMVLGNRWPWEAMTLPLPDRRGALTPRAAQPARAFLRRRRATSVVLGPGLSMAPSAARFVEKFLAVVDVPVVLDADGLNAVAAGAWPARRPPLVLTPHAGEMARLLGVTTAVVEKDRRGAARAAARRFGAVVVLKGWGTVVTDGKVDFVAGVGNPGLATGGTGDVLAGVIGALIGQANFG